MKNTTDTLLVVGLFILSGFFATLWLESDGPIYAKSFFAALASVSVASGLIVLNRN